MSQLQHLARWPLPHFDLPPEMAVAGLVAIAIIAVGIVIDLYLFIDATLKPERWSTRIASILSPRWSWRDGGTVCLFVALAFCMAYTAAQLLRLYYPDATKTSFLCFTLAWAAAFQFFSLALVWHLARRSGLALRDAFCHRAWPAARLAASGVVSYIAVLPPLLFAALVSFALLTAVGYDVKQHQQDAVMIFTDPSVPAGMKLALAFLAVFVAPVGEELMFRGVLLPAVSRHAGMAAGIALTSVVFATVHLNIPSFIPLAVLGCALSVVYIYSGHIGAPIALHACFNAASIAMVFTREHFRAHGMPV